MEMTLAENIRRFRKERSLTQEQLAEALGVTAGAVIQVGGEAVGPGAGADPSDGGFFDTSVDVLLGYTVKDNRPEATVKRLREYRRRKDPDGLPEAEKALGKYPHSFGIVSESAALYRAFGFDSGDKALFRRVLALLERSLLLLPQSEDPQISEQTIYSNPLKYSHNQGERCSFLLYRGEKNQKRNSFEVLSIPTSAGFHL